MSSVTASDKARFVIVDKRGIVTAPPQSEVARADSMSRSAAEAVARRMARWHEAGADELIVDTESTGNERDLRLSELLGIDDLMTFDPEELWEKQRFNPGLDTPLGTVYKDGVPTGIPFIRNLGTGDTGGDGPHGCFGGQSGSGKSMALESVLAGLCAWHPPDKLSLMIVDFKGKASFRGFPGMRHVRGMVHDTGDPEILERLAATLLGEIEIRKRFLEDEQDRLAKELGVDDFSLPDVGKYLMFRARGYNLKPLPTLLVIFDEATIFYEQYGKEFLEVFNYIVKQGRSVGVSIWLASQELAFLQAQQKLWAEMAFRSSLVVNTETLSRQVIGEPDACDQIVASKVKNYVKGGHIFFRFAGSDIVHLRTANNLVEYQKPGAIRASAASGTGPAPTPYTLANNWGTTDVEGQTDDHDGVATHAAPPASDGRIRTANSEISILQKKLSGPTEAPPLWTPPLRKTVTLSELETHRALTPAAGPGDLKFPLGIVDNPLQHVQHVLYTDFKTNAGSIVFAGGAKSGRTMALATMIVGSAFRFAPRMVSWLIVDQGGNLAAVHSLPNVAGYARRGNTAMRDQIFSEIQRIIDLRSKLFALHNLNSVEEYLQWRTTNPQPADPYNYLFVALDGWVSLKTQLNSEDNAASASAVGWTAALGAMIENGPNHGVHFAVTTDSSNNDLPNVAQKAVSMFFLRGADSLGDAVGTRGREILRKYPANQPGLTLNPATATRENKHEVFKARIAVPIPENIPEPTPDKIATMSAQDHYPRISALCKELSAAATNPEQRIPRLRPLPTELPLTEIWPHWKARQAQKPVLAGRPQRNIELLLGLSGVDLTPTGIPWTQDPQASAPHCLILGRPQSGRSTTLTTLATAIIGSFAPHEAKIVLLDERGTMKKLRRLLDKEHYLAAYADREDTEKVLRAVLAEIRHRIGDTDPTDEEEQQQTFFTGPELFIIVDNIDTYRPGQGASPEAAALLTEIINTRERIGVHVYASATHGDYETASATTRAAWPIGALEQTRTHIVSLSSANRTKIRGNTVTDLLIPGRAYLISDRVPLTANGKPPIIQIAHTA